MMFINVGLQDFYRENRAKIIKIPDIILICIKIPLRVPILPLAEESEDLYMHNFKQSGVLTHY